MSFLRSRKKEQNYAALQETAEQPWGENNIHVQQEGVKTKA